MIDIKAVGNGVFKINILRVLLTLGFLSFYLPNNESVLGVVYKLWRYSALFVSIIAIAIYLVYVITNDIGKKINIRYVSVILFYVYMYGITSFFTKAGQFQTYRCVYFVGFITLLELSVHCLKEIDVIKSYLFSGVSATIIYALSFIKYFNVVGGMHHGLRKRLSYGFVVTDQNWYFFTYDNASLFIFLPVAAVFVYYCVKFNNKSFKFCLMYEALVLLMYLLKSAVSAEVVFAFFVIISTVYFYKFTSRNKMKINIDYKKTWIIILIFHIMIITIVGSDIAYKIAGYFGKDGSFTGRDVIWSRAKEYISLSPIFGYGMEDTLFKTMKLVFPHCHNILLEILYDGGIIGFVLYAVFIINFTPRNNNNFTNSIFNLCLLCYLIGQGFETQLAFPYLIPIFYFNYYYSSKTNPMEISFKRSILSKKRKLRITR